MNESGYSLGIIETVGFPGLVAAADAAAKAADVKVMTYQKAESGIVTVYIIGDVASVQASVAVGKEEASRVGQLRHVHVIPRPSEDVFKMINHTLKEKPSRITKGKNDKSSELEKVKGRQQGKSDPITELEKKTVSELKKMALETSKIPLTEQQIKNAKKESLIEHLLEIEQKEGGDEK